MTYNHNIARFYRKLQRTRVYRKLSSFIPQYAAMRIFLSYEFPFCFLKRGQTAIQIGSAGSTLPIGLNHPMKMRAMVGRKGRVIVIEPEDENMRAIQQYCKNNKLENVEFIQKGIWNEPAILEFKVSVEGKCSTANVISKIEPDEFRNAPERSTLPVDSLDNLLKEFPLASIDFINITVNGAEPEAITGAIETISRFRPILSFVTENHRTEEKMPAILEVLDKYRYELMVTELPTTKNVRFRHGVAIPK